MSLPREDPWLRGGGGGGSGRLPLSFGLQAGSHPVHREVEVAELAAVQEVSPGASGSRFVFTLKVEPAANVTFW